MHLRGLLPQRMACCRASAVISPSFCEISGSNFVDWVAVRIQKAKKNERFTDDCVRAALVPATMSADDHTEFTQSCNEGFVVAGRCPIDVAFVRQIEEALDQLELL